MRIHIQYGPRREYNPKVGDTKVTKQGTFRRVRRLAWSGGNMRQVMGTQVSGSRALYDWIDEKYYDPYGLFGRTQEWWNLAKEGKA